jgi:hypothetical protein
MFFYLVMSTYVGMHGLEVRTKNREYVHCAMTKTLNVQC